MTRGLALVLACAIVSCQPLCGRAAQAAPARLALTLDGKQAGSVVAERDRDGVAVPLATIAKPLGWTLARDGSAWELQGEGHAFVLHAGSRSVTDAGAVALVLDHAPSERNRALFVEIADLAALFGIRTRLGAGELSLSTTVLDAGFAVAERKKPPVKPSAPQVAIAPTPVPFGSYGTDRVAMTVLQRGGTRTFGVAVTTTGAIRTGLAFSDDGLPPTGAATFGMPNRNLTIGSTFDPLAGPVFHDAGLIGVDVHDGGLDLFGGRRMSDGRTTEGIARTHGATTDMLEVLRAPGGAFDQLIAGHRVDRSTSWGTLREEVFVSEKGLAAGVFARTRGRFYGELTAAAAGGGLPFESGDAPVVADGAYELSPATTARAGFAAGRGERPSPFVGLLERGAHFGGTVTFATHFTGVSGSYANAGANAQFAVSHAAGATSYALRSSVAARGSSLDVAASADDLGDRDFTVEMRFPRRGFDLFGGYEAARAGGAAWSSPIVGLALPLVRGLDLEASLSPVGSKPALRVSLVAGFTPPHRAPRIAMVPLVLRSDGPLPEIVAIFVDGFRVRATSTEGRVDVSPGRHTVRIETIDGTRGSADFEIDTGSVRELALSMWPIRPVAGRVAIEASPSLIPRDLSLAGIGVLLEPGDIPATVDDEGKFAFPSVPVCPGAEVRVDESTLPPGVAALGPVVVGPAGEVVLRLGPDRRVEKTVFPRS